MGKIQLCFKKPRAVLDHRIAEKEQALIMCDEIQMKQGVRWSTKTGRKTGLENDIPDLKTVLHRLLSPDAGRTQEAKKANQWLVMSFGTEGMDAWLGPFFFNDGTLSGATLANQFLWVTIGCETIGCEVLAVALDAGGCNARFVKEFFCELKNLPTNDG